MLPSTSHTKTTVNFLENLSSLYYTLHQRYNVFRYEWSLDFKQDLRPVLSFLYRTSKMLWHHNLGIGKKIRGDSWRGSNQQSESYYYSLYCCGMLYTPCVLSGYSGGKFSDISLVEWLRVIGNCAQGQFLSIKHFLVVWAV